MESFLEVRDKAHVGRVRLSNPRCTIAVMDDLWDPRVVFVRSRFRLA